MLNVLLICSMGASTGALCEKIKKAADQQNYDINIWATSLATANDEIEKSDIILLGPQIRYMLKKIVEAADGRPVEAIDMATYGMMDGEAVFNKVKEMALNNEK
ncbi:PTS sugar transporter subunit IIB [Anaerorhabdus furcosa]|uniref:PTS system, cellobiose-specific IIB component n=1 Tax=Anaerorhabdus furcosa TaxID=118967 RepID=A0A1T4NBQ0_9FIRM|nr:PTS sugar transporter subunit IIB [Anaerorhabdus furcosa]SJZ76681.1 PTS system, cellobiose-specific IIB component [Anaerorhabdus furcosa]